MIFGTYKYSLLINKMKEKTYPFLLIPLRSHIPSTYADSTTTQEFRLCVLCSIVLYLDYEIKSDFQNYLSP